MGRRLLYIFHNIQSWYLPCYSMGILAQQPTGFPKKIKFQKGHSIASSTFVQRKLAKYQKESSKTGLKYQRLGIVSLGNFTAQTISVETS